MVVVQLHESVITVDVEPKKIIVLHVGNQLLVDG